jgi:predicted dehydrogenase
VEDEATIVLTYSQTQVIIQASWNWSHNVKSMQVYGKAGYVICENGTDMKILEDEKVGSYLMKVNSLGAGFDNPFSMLHNVVRNGYKFPAFDPSSIENNEIVVRILDAAKYAAQTGQIVTWKDYYK